MSRNVDSVNGASQRATDESAALAEARALVERLENNDTRWPAWQRLQEMGTVAAPAVREGLRDGRWQVRKWCAAFLDHHSDPDTIPELLPLLHDPKSDVRLWAVHSLSCDRCKDEGMYNPIDYVPHLVERIERDDSIRVRRMAMVMLATGHPDARAVRVFEHALATETDRKLRKHAEWGLKRLREVGLVSGR